MSYLLLSVSNLLAGPSPVVLCATAGLSRRRRTGRSALSDSGRLWTVLCASCAGRSCWCQLVAPVDYHALGSSRRRVPRVYIRGGVVGVGRPRADRSRVRRVAQPGVPAICPTLVGARRVSLTGSGAPPAADPRAGVPNTIDFVRRARRMCDSYCLSRANVDF